MNINKSEFLELVKAESVARKSTAVPVDKEKLRAELENDVEAFLKNGGQVQELPTGYSGEFSQFNGRPMGNAQKGMRNVMAASVAAAHARRNHPGVIARNNARDGGARHYHGTACRSCGGTLRYTSTNACFSCNKAFALSAYQKKKGAAA